MSARRTYDNSKRFLTEARKWEPYSSLSSVSSGDSSSFSSEPSSFALLIGVDALFLKEVKEKTDNFGLKACIGEGRFGRLYFAQLDSGRGVAVVKINVSHDVYDSFGYCIAQKFPARNFYTCDFEKDFDRLRDTSLMKIDASANLLCSHDAYFAEVSRVKMFKHENLVEFLGYTLQVGIGILAYDFGNIGSLQDILHGKKGLKGGKAGPVLDWMQRVKIALNAARGLEYLHKNSIVHRDISSSKVLLFEDFKAKIADFNLSKHQDPAGPEDWASNYTTFPQPYGYGYHSPEYIEESDLTQKSNVFSFGVVLLELLTGRKPVDHTMPLGQHNLVAWATPRLQEVKVNECVDPKLAGNYPPKAAAKLAAVAALCVRPEAQHRPDMTTVIKALQPLSESIAYRG